MYSRVGCLNYKTVHVANPSSTCFLKSFRLFHSIWCTTCYRNLCDIRIGWLPSRPTSIFRLVSFFHYAIVFLILECFALFRLSFLWRIILLVLLSPFYHLALILFTLLPVLKTDKRHLSLFQLVLSCILYLVLFSLAPPPIYPAAASLPAAARIKGSDRSKRFTL